MDEDAVFAPDRMELSGARPGARAAGAGQRASGASSRCATSPASASRRWRRCSACRPPRSAAIRRLPKRGWRMRWRRSEGTAAGRVTAEQWRRLEDLFMSAQDLPPHERAEFVAREPAAIELKGELSGMLAHATTGAGRSRGDRRRGGIGAPRRTPSAAVGPYRIVAKSAAAAWASFSRRCATTTSIGSGWRSRWRRGGRTRAAERALQARAADPRRARPSQHRALPRRRHRRRPALPRHGARRRPADHRALRGATPRPVAAARRCSGRSVRPSSSRISTWSCIAT